MTRRRASDRMPVTATARYADARRAAPAHRLALAPRWRWWRAPACWVVGHRWPTDVRGMRGGALHHCRRCGEEFGGRV